MTVHCHCRNTLNIFTSTLRYELLGALYQHACLQYHICLITVVRTQINIFSTLIIIVIVILIIISTFVKCEINGPQMCYNVELTWNIFYFCINIWTKKDDSLNLKSVGKLFRTAAAETVKSPALRVVLVLRNNSFMVSADRSPRPGTTEPNCVSTC